MNKPVYLGLSILELSEIVMQEFWYDYVKLKHEEKTKRCYIDTESLIVCMKTDDIYTQLKMLKQDLILQPMNWKETKKKITNNKRKKRKKVIIIIDYNERQIGRKNYERICCIKSNNLQVLYT